MTKKEQKPEQQAKKTVKYLTGLGAQFTRIAVGESAFIVPVDHPDAENVTNGNYAMTSRVQSYDAETGVFETLNTVYVPFETVVQ